MVRIMLNPTSARCPLFALFFHYQDLFLNYDRTNGYFFYADHLLDIFKKSSLLKEEKDNAVNNAETDDAVEDEVTDEECRD